MDVEMVSTVLQDWTSTEASVEENTTDFGSNCTFINGTAKGFVYSHSDAMAAGIAATFYTIFGTFLNLVIILALLNHKSTRRHVTTPFIISLSLSDTLFSCIVLPIQATTYFAKDWIAGGSDGFFCRVYPVLCYVNAAVSLFSIMAITINRWVMIFFPSASESIFTQVRSMFYISLCWILPVALTLPSYFGIWGKVGLEEFTKSCTILTDDYGRSPKVVLLTIGVIIPTLLLIIANSMIYYKIIRIRKKIQSSNVTPPKGLREREQKLAKMMLIIFTFFVLSFMPYYLAKTVIDPHLCNPSIHAACDVFLWSSVIANPIIYVVTQERYRDAIKLLYQSIKTVGKKDEFGRPIQQTPQVTSTPVMDSN